MKKQNTKIWLLVGHRIPEQVEAYAVFTSKPTKAQLLKTVRFNNNKLDNALIDCLLEHGICGTVDYTTDFRFEYFFAHPDTAGNLKLGDYLFTGILDMKPELLINLNKAL